MKFFIQDSHGQTLDMGQFVIGGNWLKCLETLEKDGAWGDHIATMELATALSYDIRIISSAAGTDDCFDIMVEPHNQAASHTCHYSLGITQKTIVTVSHHNQW
jgi:hypothetical protein